MSFLAWAPRVFSSHGRAFLRAGMTAQALRAAKRASAGAIRNGGVQTARTARQRAEVRHHPLGPGKFQPACHQSCGLPQWQPDQRLQRQARLDRRIGKGGRSAPFAGRRAQPLRLRSEPDLQRTTLLGCGVLEAPVRRTIARRCGFAHAHRLTSWSTQGIPEDLCNRAGPSQRANSGDQRLQASAAQSHCVLVVCLKAIGSKVF